MMLDTQRPDRTELLSKTQICAELENLASYINNARHEIAALRPTDINTDHIPRATDELDAVVGATEEATNKIMDICDEIGEVVGSCSPEIAAKLNDFTTRIFEACNFQDITGQRITKVVQTLKQIDVKVTDLLKIFGNGTAADKDSLAVRTGEAALLNGPALPQDAVDQDDIDRLMSDT